MPLLGGQLVDTIDLEKGGGGAPEAIGGVGLARGGALCAGLRWAAGCCGRSCVGCGLQPCPAFAVHSGLGSKAGRARGTRGDSGAGAPCSWRSSGLPEMPMHDQPHAAPRPLSGALTPGLLHVAPRGRRRAGQIAGVLACGCREDGGRAWASCGSAAGHTVTGKAAQASGLGKQRRRLEVLAWAVARGEHWRSGAAGLRLLLREWCSGRGGSRRSVEEQGGQALRRGSRQKGGVSLPAGRSLPVARRRRLARCWTLDEAGRGELTRCHPALTREVGNPLAICARAVT